MTKVMLDLCAGLGGASEAFMDSPNWEVIRVDNNELLKDVPGMWIEDIVDIADGIQRGVTHIPSYDLVWFSPPCVDFSLAYDAPQSKAYRDGEDYEPDMLLLDAGLVILDRIREVNPNVVWVVENVRGAIKHFRPRLGEPRQIIGSLILWGNFPLLPIPRGFSHSKYDNDTWSTDPLRANKRAMIPYDVSRALCDALSAQTSLFDFF